MKTPQPRRSSPARPPRQGGSHSRSEVPAALQQTLSITSATSEEELTARTVEAAGRLTGATVACAVDAAGATYSWGEPALVAAAIGVCARLGQPYGRSGAFAHLGLPVALTAYDAGSRVAVAAVEADRFGTDEEMLFGLVLAHCTIGRDRLRLTRLADRDPLTGLRHYRPFEERLASSQPNRTAVVAIDIDNFKQINDLHGHQAGDEALVAVVGALGRALRGDDHIYRIGGDEFAVVIDVAGPAEVSGITRRILLAARAAGYPISVGAALRQPAESGRETLLRADRALYQAKREGRNTARMAA